MPSHEVHSRLATKYLGVPISISADVDRVIDLGPLHDMGRRMPRKPQSYLEIIEAGETEKLYKVRTWEKVVKILTELLGNELKAKVFYFHHALDILSFRAASALVLNLDPKKICNNLVKGTLYDLEMINAKLREINIMSNFKLFNQEIYNAICKSCTDGLLLSWVRENLVQKYRIYKSIEFLKEKLLEKIPNILNSDAKYELGCSLGVVSLINSMSKTCKGSSIRVYFKIGGTEIIFPENGLVDRESIIKKYMELLRSKFSSYKLSSYGLGRFRKIIVSLSALYSDLYHLPFIEPIPLSIAVEDLLSVRKKKYSMARNVLKSYSYYKNNFSEARKYAAYEVSSRLKMFTNIIDEHRLEEIKLLFLEALEELLIFSRDIGIDVLNDL